MNLSLPLQAQVADSHLNLQSEAVHELLDSKSVNSNGYYADGLRKNMKLAF